MNGKGNGSASVNSLSVLAVLKRDVLKSEDELVQFR